jgi:predicted phage terminase large subunit-like protein
MSTATLPRGWQDWPAPAQEQLLAALRSAALAKLGHLRPRWATPGELAQRLDPKTRQTTALELIDAELVRLLDTPDGRLIISCPPQEGKSQRVSRRFPLWALTQRPDTRIAIASYEHGVARRWGRAIRDDITVHGAELGLTVRDDLSAQQEWQLVGHEGGVYAAGIGGALTGRPVDLMLIDDPVKDRAQADSPTYRERAWDWWTDVAATRLAPGAPVALILTRWHEDDLAGRLLAAEDGHLWRVVNIPAQADHDPAKGETDPLGREPGEFMVSARGRTKKQWEAIKVRSGSRTWASLYQGRPAPAAGDVFLREWWQEYSGQRWIVRPDGSHWVAGADEVAMSWDMAFKATDGSDYVVGQVWARYGMELFLLDQVHDRLSFTETCAALRQLAAKWPQASAKYVEDKANGTAVIDSLSRQVPGLIPVEPDGSKEARARAVTPFIESGSVYLPSPEVAPWIGGFLQEHNGFPNSAHDDQVDACTQAIHRMLLAPILSGSLIIESDDLDDDTSGYEISPY